MSRQLQTEHNENVSWTHTLEERVEQKTRELKRAHEHALHTEKMASIGKMAAVLAHEINNPLSGILTYSKLLRKWIDREDGGASPPQGNLRLPRSDRLRKPALRRSRQESAYLLPHHAHEPAARESEPGHRPFVAAGATPVGSRGNSSRSRTSIPICRTVLCDAAQIEQVILALVMNALDAMPQGGNLWLDDQLRP